MAEVFNIAYCFDENYEQHAAASAMSVISNFALDTKQLAFHFLADVVTPKMVAYAADLERKYGCTTKLYEAGVHSEAIYETIPKSLFEGKYWSPVTLFRLILPKILPESISRILYLDCDTIILDDISKIFQFDLGSNAAAAVLDPSDREDVPLLGVSKYFGAGVLLIDMNYWRNNDIGQKCLDYLAMPGAIVGYLDQDAINKILDEKIFALPERWNLHAANGITSPKASREARSIASILHYITKNKPWQAWYYNRVKEHYWAYLLASPWKDAVEQQPTKVWQWHQMAIAATKEGRFQNAVEHYELIVQHYQMKKP